MNPQVSGAVQFCASSLPEIHANFSRISTNVMYEAYIHSRWNHPFPHRFPRIHLLASPLHLPVVRAPCQGLSAENLSPEVEAFRMVWWVQVLSPHRGLMISIWQLHMPIHRVGIHGGFEANWRERMHFSEDSGCLKGFNTLGLYSVSYFGVWWTHISAVLLLSLVLDELVPLLVQEVLRGKKQKWIYEIRDQK